MKTMPLLLCALLPFSAQAADLGHKIPKQFQGRWEFELSSCAGDDGEGTLYINPRSVSMWESSGEFVAVVTKGEREAILVADLSTEGDSQLWSEHYQLSEDGSELLDPNNPDAMPMHRCPPEADTRDIEACKKGLTPLHSVPPVMPPGREKVTGTMDVSYIVREDGRVDRLTAFSSTWDPAGGPIDVSDDWFQQTVLAAVAQWTFASRTRPCRNFSTIEVGREQAR